MIRTLFAVASFVASSALAAPPIDLDVPANAQAIEATNPGEYAKIQRILAEASKRALNPQSVEQVLRTEFQASDVQMTSIVMTSYPPKKRLGFTLDGKAYTKVITVEAEPTVVRALPGGEDREAVRALTQAARGGDCRAAKRLGDIYEQGTPDISRDRAEAFKWYNAARTMGCDVPLERRKN